jgi:hypothetical protein
MLTQEWSVKTPTTGLKVYDIYQILKNLNTQIEKLISL